MGEYFDATFLKYFASSSDCFFFKVISMFNITCRPIAHTYLHNHSELSPLHTALDQSKIMNGRIH